MESEVKRGQIIYSFLLLAIVLIFAFAFLIPSDIQLIFTGKAIVNNTVCIPQWSCTAWSPCLGDSQIRSCVDVNSCGNQTNKPLEALTCGVCEPNWQCGEWEPEECPETEIQRKECKDLNNCGTIRLKPADTKSCTYFKNFGWIYWFIIMLQLLMILLVILLIIKKFDDLNNPDRNLIKDYQDYPHYSKDNPYGFTEFQRFLQQNPEYVQEIIQKHQDNLQKTPQKTSQDDQEYMPKTSSQNYPESTPKMPQMPQTPQKIPSNNQDYSVPKMPQMPQTSQKIPPSNQDYYIPKMPQNNQDYYTPKMPPQNISQTYPINQKFIPKKFPVNSQNLRDNPQ